MSKTNVAELIGVQFAEHTTSTSLSFYRYPVYGDGECQFGMSYWFWVIRCLDGEIIVFDTGFSSESGGKRGRAIVIQPSEALGALGIDPAEVRTVVLSHLHWDHTGHVDLFPNARVVLDHREWSFWNSDYATKPVIAVSGPGEDLMHLEAAQSEGRLYPVDLAEDLELTAGVRLHRVGGHTPGSAVLILEGVDHSIILAGDAVHYEVEYRQDRPFSVFTDIQEMFDAYEYFRKFEAQSGVVVPGHSTVTARKYPMYRGLPWARQLLPRV